MANAPSHRFEPFSNRFNRLNTDSNPYMNSQYYSGLLDEGQQRRQQPYDKARAPKFAALILFVCFMGAGTYHIMNGLDLDALAKSSTSVHSSKLATSMPTQQYYTEKENYSFHRTQRIKNLFQEISTPILNSEGREIIFPEYLSNYAEISENMDSLNEVPVFWHIPRSGGSLITNVAAYCLDLTQASNVGALIDPGIEKHNEITTIVDNVTGARFVNVDATSPEGMMKARQKNGELASYPGLDLIITPYILNVAELLLTEQNKGRMFVMMRHPVERAESMYHSLKKYPETGTQAGENLLAYATGKKRLLSFLHSLYTYTILSHCNMFYLKLNRTCD